MIGLGAVSSKEGAPDPWMRARDLAALTYELFDICIDQKDEFETQKPSNSWGQKGLAWIDLYPKI
jgi:hypothetical protein